MYKSSTKQHFFWEKSSSQRLKKKSRFNLLLLEYGEYFLEDFSAYSIPFPSDSSGRSFKYCESLKTQGRLKLCSRSILFEPNDSRKPIIRFPFKNFLSEPSLYQLSPDELLICTVQFSGCFVFQCSTVYEMKSNERIAPYQQVDYNSRGDGTQILFGLVHSDPNAWINKLLKLREIFSLAMHQGWSVAQERLMPFIASPASAFDSSQLVDFHETPCFASAVPVQRVRPLELIPGGLMVTDSRIYFQPAFATGLGEGAQLQVLELRNVALIYTRRHLLSRTGLELIMADGETSALFSFSDEETRNKMQKLLTDQSKRCGGLLPHSLEHMLRLWQARKISNFDYLCYLNAEAGRSLSDLAQYPVFPHVLVDFKSSELDLSRPEVYRDLSKPVGALNPQRLEHFRQRYQNMVSTAAAPSPPPFLYGTHYSTPGYVLFYLARVAPEHMLCLQGGKFDNPDRMFSSISGMFDSCLSNPADLKELIPEFFVGEGEFLVNSQNLDFGRLQQGVGQKLGDVELPAWSKGSPKEFVRLHRSALESEHVSQNLHLWIDLIFGFKQQGQAALEADNLFFHLTYESVVDELAREQTDARQTCALEAQVQEFGQTPTQLFGGPHPARSDSAAIVTVLSRQTTDVASPSPLRKASENTTPSQAGSPPTITSPVKPKSQPSTAGSPPTIAGKGSLGLSLLQSVTQQTVALLDRSFFGSARPQNGPGVGKPSPAAGGNLAAGVTPMDLPPPPAKGLNEGLRVWTCVLRAPLQSTVTSLASSDSSHRPRGPPLLCVGLSDGYMSIYSLRDPTASSGESGTATLSLRRTVRLSSATLVVCLSGDGALAVAGSADGQLYSYSVLKGSVLCQRNAHEDAVSALGLDSSGSWVVTACRDGTVRLWTVLPGGGLSQTPAVELLELKGPVTATSMFSAGRSNRLVACGTEDGVVMVWDVQAVGDSKGLWSLRGTVLCMASADSGVGCCSWLPVGAERSKPVLLCGYSDGSLVAWEVGHDLTKLADVHVGHSLLALSVTVSNVPLIFGSASDGAIRSWALQRNSEKKWTFREVWTDQCQSMAITSVDGVLVTGGLGGICLWEMRIRRDS